MENNQLFEAEAILEDDEVEQRLGGHNNNNGTGIRAMTAGDGVYDKHLVSVSTEESPLLANRSGGASGEDNDGDTGTQWPGATDFEGLPWWKRPSVRLHVYIRNSTCADPVKQIFWLLPAYLIFAIAWGGIIVPRLNLVVSLICSEYLAERSVADPSFTFAPVVLSGDNPQCQIPEIQALSSKFMLYLTLIGGILAAVSSPKIGTLSDRYGRTPLLAITSVGGLISEVITILAAKYPNDIRYTWLLAGAVTDGICGSFIAGFALTHSYAADTTPPAKRAVAFGFIQGCFFIGIAIGPIVAAYLVEATSSILSVFYLALSIHLCFLCYVLVLMPESLSRKRQLAAREKFNMEPRDGRHILTRIKSANVLEPLKILYPTGEGSSPQLRMNLLALSAVSAIMFGSAMASMTVVLLYSEYQFGWENKETNLFVSVANVCRVSALVIILPLLNYVFRTRYKNKVRRDSGIELVEKNSGSDQLDLWTIRASLVVEIVGYSGYAFVRTGSLFVMSAVFAATGGIGSPILQSSLTKHVPHDRTGQLLGAIGLLHALARVVFPTGISLIYAYTVKTFPQLVFIILVACFGSALICSLFIRPHGKHNTSRVNSLIHGSLLINTFSLPGRTWYDVVGGPRTSGCGSCSR
jgi:MFS family permease